MGAGVRVFTDCLLLADGASKLRCLGYLSITRPDGRTLPQSLWIILASSICKVDVFSSSIH